MAIDIASRYQLSELQRVDLSLGVKGVVEPENLARAPVHILAIYEQCEFGS